MKRMLAVLCAVVCLAVTLVACGSTCKVKGCDSNTYKDGYCKYHYTLNEADSTAKGLFDGLFGE